MGLIEHPEEISSVLDLCTGSGCLAILATYLFDNAMVDAVDLSPKAVEVAKINIENSMFSDRLTLFKGDLFAPLKGRTYDLIITNPPYVDANDMKGMRLLFKQLDELPLRRVNPEAELLDPLEPVGKGGMNTNP